MLRASDDLARNRTCGYADYTGSFEFLDSQGFDSAVDRYLR